MKTILNIKTDKGLKMAAQDTASELGLPLTTAINAFLKQFVRDREITVSASYKPSAYLRKVIKEAELDYAGGRVRSFNSVEKFLETL